jgi:hypothetical protein
LIWIKKTNHEEGVRTAKQKLINKQKRRKEKKRRGEEEEPTISIFPLQEG